jgi:pilus assembly protein TadC
VIDSIIKKIKKDVEMREIEQELPFFIRSYAVFREIGVDSIEALENASFGLEKMRKVCEPVILNLKKEGINGKRIIEIGTAYESEVLIRGFRLIALNIESGESASTLMNFSKELLNEEKLKNQERNSKSALFTLAFVAVVCIAPVLVFLGSTLLREIDPKSQINIEVMVGAIFPIISMAFVFFAKLIIPKNNSQRKVKFKMQDLIIIAPVAIITIVAKEWIVFAVGISLILTLILRLLKENEIRTDDEIGDEIFSAVLGITSIPKTMNLEQILRIVQRESRGKFRKEMERCIKQIDAGISPTKALIDLEKQVQHPSLSKFTEGLLICQKIGNFEKLNLVIDDIIEARSIERERRNQISMQKYTIYASLLISPIILKSIIGIISKISQNGEGNAQVAVAQIFISVFFGIILISLLNQKEKDKYRDILIFGIISQAIFMIK